MNSENRDNSPNIYVRDGINTHAHTHSTKHIVIGIVARIVASKMQMISFRFVFYKQCSVA